MFASECAPARRRCSFKLLFALFVTPVLAGCGYVHMIAEDFHDVVWNDLPEHDRGYYHSSSAPEKYRRKKARKAATHRRKVASAPKSTPRSHRNRRKEPSSAYSPSASENAVPKPSDDAKPDKTASAAPAKSKEPPQPLSWKKPGSSSSDNAGAKPAVTIACATDDRACRRQLDILERATYRGWIAISPTFRDHASGARLIAFSRARTELKCQQLDIGIKEADRAQSDLNTAVADETRLDRPTDKLKRAIRLAATVSTQLEAERDSRC